LDIGGLPDYIADKGIFKRSFTVAGEGKFANFAYKSISFQRIFIRKINEGWDVSLATNHPMFALIRIMIRMREFFSAEFFYPGTGAIVRILCPTA